ncbi:MAG: cytochrome c-type biosis protein CcsB [Frankiales bacterium]|jgi:cytochrome c-type biogenesis protein CcsB|nr:cytochrome c-type biosis protein CcsB [Frankiales bacterium]
MSDAFLAGLSDDLLFATVLLYALAMLGFAGEQASRRSHRISETSLAAATARQATAARTRVMAGAGGPAVPEPAPLAVPSAQRSSRAGRAGLALTVLGAVLHLGSVLARGFAANRVPWGNMYEFSSAVALSVVVIFLVLLLGRRVDRGLGAFLMVPVVLYLGLAGTVLYTEAGPLVPALDSYWIKIHVFAAVLSSGAFLLSGILALLYLLRSRHDAQVAAGSSPRFPLSMGSALPGAAALDRVTYAVIAFAFPIWTFAIIAGAIWAESAWGRYWGWDPKETWSFITWVLYAGYLHARATAGWKGTKSAWIAVAAAGALIIDYYVVNIFVVGFHSYA